MTVNELMLQLSRFQGDATVVVPTRDGSIGARSCRQIVLVGSGIDWDNGKVFLLLDKSVKMVKNEHRN